MNVQKPLIGISADATYPQRQPGGDWYSPEPWYALRFKYTEAVTFAGGIPLILPYVPDDVDSFKNILDGLILTGGGFDIDPAHYGEEIRHPSVFTKPARSHFEMAIARSMLKENKPVLGICGGMQALNVLFGGSLHQHLPDDIQSPINHTQEQDRHIPQHTISLKPHTLLSKAAEGKDQVAVNSVHHQGVKVLGEGLRKSALAEDGLIEGFESTRHAFCLGVQWHPEFLASPFDQNIFKGFIEACHKKGK